MMSTQNGCALAICLIETESRHTQANSKQTMVVMASDGPSPHSPSLRLGLPAPQTSIGNHFWSFFWFSNKQHYLSRHHAQSCWAPHFMTQERIMFSNHRAHPKQAAPLSRRDCERRHAVGSHSALALRLYPAACNLSSSCRFWVLDHLCSDWFQLFYSCWFTEIRSLNLCVCFYLILFCPCFSDRNKLHF